MARNWPPRRHWPPRRYRSSKFWHQHETEGPRTLSQHHRGEPSTHTYHTTSLPRVQHGAHSGFEMFWPPVSLVPWPKGPNPNHVSLPDSLDQTKTSNPKCTYGCLVSGLPMRRWCAGIAAKSALPARARVANQFATARVNARHVIHTMT